jgi:hypothetical protein
MAVPNTSKKLFLHFRGENLADMDTFSKSDPYLVLYAKQLDGHLFEIGRTETILNNLNPQFQKTVMVHYIFETKQYFVARVIDFDNKQKDEDNDQLGSVEFDLAHVVSARGQTKAFELKPRGKLHVTAVEAAVNVADTIQLELFGRNMKKMDTFGKSDPYLKIFRQLADGTRKLIHQTEVQKVTLEPNWKPLPPIPTVNIMGKSQQEQSIRVECWDEDLFTDDSMGFFDCSVADLLQRAGDRKPFILRKTEKPGKMYGEIYVKEARIQHYPSFLEMLKNGLQINMAVAVDFTGSNGDPRQPNSLHYMGNPTQPNHYVRAIGDVARILLDYDTDKMVAAFGFGAVLPQGEVSHFFHLNMTPNPYVAGMEGLMAAYWTSLRAVRLSGPTNFAPTILGTTIGARQAAGVYTVLLIITDGEITDMDDTINALVAADDAPLSIVIVGVGNGSDFQAMNQLDGDNQALRSSSTGRVSRRDLVQFVPMRNISSPGQLAAEVLKEVPDQVEKWASLTGYGAVKT